MILDLDLLHVFIDVLQLKVKVKGWNAVVLTLFAQFFQAKLFAISFLTSAEFIDHPQMVASLIPAVEFNTVGMADLMYQTYLHRYIVT